MGLGRVPYPELPQGEAHPLYRYREEPPPPEQRGERVVLGTGVWMEPCPSAEEDPMEGQINGPAAPGQDLLEPQGYRRPEPEEEGL